MSYQFESMSAQDANRTEAPFTEAPFTEAPFTEARAILLNGALDNTIGHRSYQEDCAAIVPVGQSNQDRLVVIADGAGGHNAGDQAALIVVQRFIEAAQHGRFDSFEERPQALLECLRDANRNIGEFAQQNAIVGDIGTTAVAAIFADTQVHWISVGDSHLYVQNRDGLIKLNADHSYAAHLVETGKLSRRSPEFNDYSHILYSALTGQEPRLIDLPSSGYKPMPGDRFVLVTDGIDTLGPTGIQRILSGGTTLAPAELCRQLIDGVMEQRLPQQDNTTVAVISFDANNKNFSGSVQAGAIGASADTAAPAGRNNLKTSAILVLAFFSLFAAGWFVLSPLDNTSAAPDPASSARASTAESQNSNSVNAFKLLPGNCQTKISNGRTTTSCPQQ